MSLLTILAALAALISLLALVMTLVNLLVYRRAAPLEKIDQHALRRSLAPDLEPGEPLLSVCIPARDEEENLEACVRSALEGAGDLPLEVLVYDDQSDDATPEILERLIEQDERVRAAKVEALPEGWNGKQRACDRMARQARGRWLLFTDADVRFERGAFARALHEARRLNADLISTFPRQITGTLGERLIVPMIFFILFAYLPMPRMRRSQDPACSAGCGQFLLVTREAYDASGGHAAFPDSMHDGVKMPRRVRAAGRHADVFDGSDLASCRMYQDFPSTWRGFAKNAFEGLNSIGLLIFLTVLHVVGHLTPWAILPAAALADPIRTTPAALAGVAIACALAQRIVLAARLRHSLLGAVLHPLGVALMTLIQWRSLFLHLSGKRSWRGRTLAPAGSSAAPESTRTG